jgi:hypothetical protein
MKQANRKALFLWCVFVALSSAAYGNTSEKAATQAAFGKDGRPVVEVTQATYQANANAMEGYACQIRNVSGKNITAIGLVWNVTWSNGTKETGSSTFQSSDTFVHEDIQRGMKLKPFAPGTVRSFQSSARDVMESNELSVKGVQVIVDFVEFDDKSTAGADAGGSSKRIRETRDGAAKFKDWLKRAYQKNGLNADVLNAVLGASVPEELGLTTTQQKHGATVYRDWLRQVYQNQGAASVETVLKK